MILTMQALKSKAVGLANPFPAISGAEPSLFNSILY